MKNKDIFIYKSIIILFISIVFSGLFLISCGAVEEEENPISISSIELSSSTVNVEGIVIVTINATDKEGRTLNYEFSANAGGFPNYTDSTQNTADWVAPSVGGTYAITGKAYAGNDEDTASISVIVLSADQPLITPVYPTEGIHITAVNHEDFTFNAYHPNGVWTTYALGLVINFFVNDTLNNDLVSNPQGTSEDNKNYVFTFDLDLSSVSGQCTLEYGVRSQSGVDSDLLEINFTIEGVTQDY